MPYVARDAQGKICALIAEAGTAAERLPVEHPEVLEFLTRTSEQPGGGISGMEMLLSDLKLIRVIEDVVDLLIAKRVIMFSELPTPVQHKILQKRGKREKMFGAGGDILGSDRGLL